MSKTFDGILFIGDVHLTSAKPGRRLDNYAESMLAKMAEAAKIATERNLAPVMLGDLFHRARESDLALLTQVIAVLRSFPSVPWIIGGSHDRTESWFTEKDALNLLAEIGVVRLIAEPGLATTLPIAGKVVGLWGAPAGTRIPESIAGAECDVNILVTHHDFDFNGQYPGALVLQEVEGCSMLVNGHMHTRTEPVIKGGTVCHNPGSLCRDAINLARHEPAVSVWTPAHGASLERVPLQFKPAKDVFDFTGKEVHAASVGELRSSLPKAMALSRFASLLEKDTGLLGATGTSDGTVLLEELELYFDETNPPAALQRYLTQLVKEVAEA